MKILKILFYLSVIIIALFCLTFCATCVYTANKLTEVSKPPKISGLGIVNRYNAAQIETGMTYRQVEQLLGSTYDVQSKSEYFKIPYETRVWKDFSGLGTVVVSFSGGKVTSVSSFALD